MLNVQNKNSSYFVETRQCVYIEGWGLGPLSSFRRRMRALHGFAVSPFPASRVSTNEMPRSGSPTTSRPPFATSRPRRGPAEAVLADNHQVRCWATHESLIASNGMCLSGRCLPGTQDGGGLRRQLHCHSGDVQARGRVLHGHVPAQGLLALVHRRRPGHLQDLMCPNTKD